MRIVLLRLLIPAFFLSGQLAASADTPVPSPDTNTPTRVMVFEIETSEGYEDLAKSLTQQIVEHLGKAPSLNVFGHDELAAMLEHEKDKKFLMCREEHRCLVQLTKALDADKILVGRVGRIGEVYVVTLKIVDATAVGLERAESVSAENEEALPAQVRIAAGRLLGLEGSEERRFKMKVVPEGTKVAVLDLAGYGVEDPVVASLTELLSLELKRFEGLEVISRSEIQAMLQYQTEKLLLECKNDMSCLVEIGGALGVDYLVSGNVGKLGGSFIVNLKLMDIHQAQVAHRISEAFVGDEAELVRSLRFATAQLLGGSIGEGAGSLAIAVNTKKAAVKVDGEVQDEGIALPLSGLTAGKHGILLSSDGYFDLYKEAYIEPNALTQVHFELLKRPTPWFKKWWVWTIAGTAVAGSVTATVLLLTQKPSSGKVNVHFE